MCEREIRRAERRTEREVTHGRSNMHIGSDCNPTTDQRHAKYYTRQILKSKACYFLYIM